MIRKLIFALGILVLLFLALSFMGNETPLSNGQDYNGQLSTISIGSSTIVVDVADTFLKRRTGLSGQESLLPDRGMLFVFDEVGFHGIWMKDMNFPIDIIWIGSEVSEKEIIEQSEIFYVIDIKKDAQPSSYPEIFYPREQAELVVEVQSGFTKKHNIKIGDKVIF